MTDPITEPEPIDPGQDPRVDPPTDEETADPDDRAEQVEQSGSNIVPDELVGGDDL
jgi:hypothetical protein